MVILWLFCVIMFLAMCAMLWRYGGDEDMGWSGYRDVLIPIALGLWYSVFLAWWMIIVETGLANTIRIGYGEPTPDDPKPSLLGEWLKVGWKIRAAYGLITSFAIGIVPAILTGRPFGFIFYVLFNVALEIYLNKKKIRDIYAEPAIGASRALVVLLCS